MPDKKIEIRDFTQTDEQKVLALNEASVHFLSPVDSQRLAYLRDRAKVFWVIECEQSIAGFLIGFVDDSDYDSANYQWFKAHLKNFFYIDRVVVGDGFRGVGIGKHVYNALSKWAESNALRCLTAEIDVVPPNPASLAFHQQQGFKELAQQFPGGREKRVSLQVKFISSD